MNTAASSTAPPPPPPPHHRQHMWHPREPQGAAPTVGARRGRRRRAPAQYTIKAPCAPPMPRARTLPRSTTRSCTEHTSTQMPPCIAHMKDPRRRRRRPLQQGPPRPLPARASTPPRGLPPPRAGTVPRNILCMFLHRAHIPPPLPAPLSAATQPPHAWGAVATARSSGSPDYCLQTFALSKEPYIRRRKRTFAASGADTP